MAGPLGSGSAVVQKGAAIFPGEYRGERRAALEQAERMQEKYNYGEIVSRSKGDYSGERLLNKGV